MPKKNIFKFYTSRSHYMGRQQELFKLKRRLSAWQKLKTNAPQWLFRASRLLFEICFHFGGLLYKAVIKSFVLAKKELTETATSLKLRKLIWQGGGVPKTLAIFCLVLAITWGSFESFKFVAQALKLKSDLQVLGSFAQGYLLDGKTALENKDFAKAENKFTIAYQSFVKGQEQINQEGVLVNSLLNAIPLKKDSEAILKAAALISSAGVDITKLYQQNSALSLNAAGISAEKGHKLADSYGLLTQTLDKINSASLLFEQINSNNLPKGYREKFVLAKGNLDALKNSFGSLKDAYFLAVSLLGGNKHILVLMENNNELRPTGGFMGTFGDLKVSEGSMTSMEISSIYDLDGQLQEKIRPPFPILAINDRWYLRDANWFADFPMTAKKISSFYEKEKGGTPDAIIVLTPNIIQDLLKLTGPINLPRYGLALDADNFVEVTQVASSVNYSKVDNKPKQILADLFPVLLKKINELKKEQVPLLFEALQKNLTEKQMAIYFRDSAAQQAVSAFDWSGQLLPADRDYLNIVSSNLNGSKTDLYVDQSVNLISTIGIEGQVIDELTITRTNKMPRLDNTQNSSFMRVFVPQGAKLISNIGFDYKNIDPMPQTGYKSDSDVEAWEKTIVKDFISGTSIGQESGKTFFGNWLTVKGGESKTVKITYSLPLAISSPDHFSLLLQKQLGALPGAFSYTLNFSGRRLLWKNFDASSLETNSLSAGFSLNKDYILGAVFEKR